MLPGHFNALAERALNSVIDLLGRQIWLEAEPFSNSAVELFPSLQRPRKVVGINESSEDSGITWDIQMEVACLRERRFTWAIPLLLQDLRNPSHGGCKVADQL